MATTTVQTDTTGSDSIIAGYFANGDDAHRAINALLDEGFLPSQIGAAFHTAGAAATEESAYESAIGGGDSLRQAEGRTFNEEAVDLDTSAGGPSSGSDAVQPVGLSSGSGSPILGAGNPPPIPGSSLAHTGLPHELKSELAHDQPAARGTWTSKLRHLFNPKPSADSQKFGTGEGDLNLPSQPYSRAAFETSVSGVGVPADQSRQLSQRLAGGGAVVTVSATGRAVEVEKTFERHNGEVRFTSDIFVDTPAAGYEPHVEVFGHLEHHYRGI
jgi:hypothetical protein